MSQFVERMPAIFFGHGSPMNALGGPFASEWREIGRALPRPKAILCVSAHWFISETAVTAMERPRTIHDFYGFPKPLFDMSYPAPGDLWLAERTADVLAPVPVRLDQDWGLDHGTWSVLLHAFPEADVPVLQLSIDRSRPAAFHYELGERLAVLRDEGVLVCGSGDVVHHLGLMSMGSPPYDWAESFNEEVKRRIQARDHEALVDYGRFGEAAALSIPTPEHYLPLLYVLGARGEAEEARFFTDSIELGSVSMLGVMLGEIPPQPSPMTLNEPSQPGIA